MAAPSPSTGLRDVLRSVLDAGASNNTIQSSSNAPAGSEPPALLEAVYFSRWFLPTYYIFIVAVVLIASIENVRTQRKRRKLAQESKTKEKQTPQTLSSASSVVESDETNIRHTERTSLLGQHSTFEARSGFPSRLYSRAKASLMYQPSPMPALTASSNQLPNNSTTFVILFLFALNLFYLLYKTEFSLFMAFAFAYRAGLFFVVNLPVLYILGAKNNQPLKWLTGWSYEKVNIFHRRLGEWMIILGLLHFVGMLVTFGTLIIPQGYSWSWFFGQSIIVFGLCAITSFLMLWGTSIGYVREKAYEFFLASHIVLQIVALVALFFHHRIGRPYYGSALAIWVLDRGVARILVSNERFIATLEIAEDRTTVLLYCDIILDRSKRGNIKSGWEPGQHVFLTVPGMKWHHAFQAHPFTIGSPAPATAKDGVTWPMQLIIRCKDGFSRDLLEYAEFHQHAEVYLDGPYGDSQLEDAVLRADRVCLIAGGSGITVTYPLAWSLWAKGLEIPMVSNRTVYHQGKRQAPRLLLRSTPSEYKGAHFWVRQRPDHSSWITMFPNHHNQPPAASDTGHCINGVNLVSRVFETRQHVSTGRPDIATEVRSWLEDDDRVLDKRQRVCLVVSGPDSLVRDVRNCASLLVKKGYNIELHVEKFGW